MRRRGNRRLCRRNSNSSSETDNYSLNFMRNWYVNSKVGIEKGIYYEGTV